MPENPTRSAISLASLLLSSPDNLVRLNAANHQIPPWLLQTMESRRITVPFSVVAPRLESLGPLPLHLQDLASSAFRLTDPTDASVVLLRIAEDPSLSSVSSGRCGLQAGLCLIDGGDCIRGWNVIQRSMARISQTVQAPTAPALFRAIDWLAIASGAVATGDLAAAEVWLKRVVMSLQGRVIANAANSPAGANAACIESCRLLADALALRAVVQLQTNNQAAFESLSDAGRFYLHSDDGESLAMANVLMSALYAANGDLLSSGIHAQKTREQLSALNPDQATFRTSILWTLISPVDLNISNSSPAVCVINSVTEQNHVARLVTQSRWN